MNIELNTLRKDIPMLTEKQFEKIAGMPEVQGMYMYREYHIFGYYPAFRSRDGKEHLFYFGGKFYNPAELLADLQENWVPQAQDEVLYKLDHMEGAFKSAFQQYFQA